MEKILMDSLSSIALEFKTNELAYLALTSKIEQPLRDRWAFVLHRKLQKDIIVSREWLRTDIALITNQEPIALIELKAMYTFDATSAKSLSSFVQDMEKDESKAKNLASKSVEIYTILLATHPKSIIPIRFEQIVKYAPGINNAIRKFKDADSVREVAINEVNDKFVGKNVIASGNINGGKAFNVYADCIILDY